MEQTAKQDVCNRIEMLRFLMIVGVVIVHVGTMSVSTMPSDDWFWSMVVFFKDGLFRGSVPILSVISGYLLFSGNNDLHYVRLLQKKGKTVLIPYLIFNVAYFLVEAFGQYRFGYSIQYNPKYIQTSMDWVNALISYDENPYNQPLHFMRELMVLTVLSPVFGYMLRRCPGCGLLAVAAFFISDIDGHLMNRPDMAVCFYVGGMVAVTKWKAKSLDGYAIPAAVTLAVCCAAIVYYRIDNIITFRVGFPILIWIAASMLVETKFGVWARSMSKYSFFMYCAHWPFMLIWYKLEDRLGHLDPKVQAVVLPIVLVVSLVYTHKVLCKMMPRVFSFALGSRSEGKVPSIVAVPRPA